MSLVERLAEKRKGLAILRAVEDPTPFDFRVKEARWLLNAIADELEEVEADKEGPFRNMRGMAEWFHRAAEESECK